MVNVRSKERELAAAFSAAVSHPDARCDGGMLNQLHLEEAGVGHPKNYETNNSIHWRSVFFNQTVGDRTFLSGFGRNFPGSGLGGHSAFWRVGGRDCRAIRHD